MGGLFLSRLNMSQGIYEWNNQNILYFYQKHIYCGGLLYKIVGIEKYHHNVLIVGWLCVETYTLMGEPVSIKL